MKKIILTYVVIASLVILGGCEKQLEENPPARFAIQNLNKNLAEALVSGTYEPLSRSRGRLWESSLSTNLEKMAEYGKGPNALDNLEIYNFQLIYNNFLDPFRTFYEAIGRANSLIANLEVDKNLIQTDRDMYRGEAKFIRAVCYYNLVRLYGSVPLRLNPVENHLETATPLATEAVLYDQIISDLKDAEVVLPNTVPEAKAGRATAGAAKTMLADVYLTRKDYVNAKAKALEVMNNAASVYKYGLVTDLNTLYSPTQTTNSEDIFSIKFAQIPGFGNFIAAGIADANAKALGFAARGLASVAALNSPLIAQWDNVDKRKSFNLYNSYVLNGVTRNAIITAPAAFRFGKYKDPGAIEETAAGNDFYLYRYADVLLIFAEADNMLNPLPTLAAYDAINRVRRRGYGVNINVANATADLPAGLTTAQFDERVFTERGYEFMYESKRWFDIKRTGRQTTVMPAAGKPIPVSMVLPLPDVEVLNNPGAKK